MTKERDDEVLKRSLADNNRYADLINGFCFEGEQVVKAEDLSDRDSQTGYHKKGTAVTGKRNIKTRDLFRKTRFGVNFAVIGIENQQKVHYLMPLRCKHTELFRTDLRQVVDFIKNSRDKDKLKK